MTQDISGLPEGTYTFSAILRGQSTANMKLVAKTATSSGTASFTGLNATSTADDEFHQGWRRVTTSPVQVQRGETLTISLEMNAEATAWWSADHFMLTLTEIPEELTSIECIDAQTPHNDNHVTHKVFDLTGRAIPQTILKPGIYIINSKKVLVK